MGPANGVHDSRAGDFSPLSVAFVGSSLSRQAGGIFEASRQLAQHLYRLPNVRVAAFGTHDKHFMDDATAWAPVSARAFAYHGPAQFRWSPGLRAALLTCDANIVHLHGLWMHTSIVARAWMHRSGRPYITSPHGMLDPWALRNSSFKKRIVGRLYEHDCLSRAGCLHVLTLSEREAIRQVGLRNPVCVIPNGVELPTEDAVSSVASCPTADRRTLLYVGRFHPKKGIANLLHAWRSLQEQSFAPLREWSLALVGWDQDGHERELRRLASELGIASDVKFCGPAFGQAKEAAYRGAAAAVLPSFSEGLPMSVLEAWSYSKPVLMTSECNLPEGATAGAAITVEPSVDALASGLATMLEASDQERGAMGRRGRRLVEQRFTWGFVAAEMVAVYRWLVGGGSPPASVET